MSTALARKSRRSARSLKIGRPSSEPPHGSQCAVALTEDTLDEIAANFTYFSDKVRDLMVDVESYEGPDVAVPCDLLAESFTAATEWLGLLSAAVLRRSMAEYIAQTLPMPSQAGVE